jgi:hypothetical protein
MGVHESRARSRTTKSTLIREISFNPARGRGEIPMAMSEPGTKTNVPADRSGKAWWKFVALGAGCGGLAFGSFFTFSWGFDTGWPRIALTAALIGVLAGTVTGLAVRASTIRGLSLPRQMAAWGAMGGWIVVVLLFFFFLVEGGMRGASGPRTHYKYPPGFEGFRDHLSDAVRLAFFPTYAIMSCLVTAIGATIGAVAAVVWRLLRAAARWVVGLRRKPAERSH